MRICAGQDQVKSVHSPGLTISASAIPSGLYGSLSPEVLSNGLFARLIILQSDPRGRGRQPVHRELPATIVDAAKHWASLPPGTGNLSTETPAPHVITYETAVERILSDFQGHCDDYYAKAEHSGDDVGTSVWCVLVKRHGGLG